MPSGGWNRGLIKETDPRVAKQGAAISAAKIGKKNPKISAVQKGKSLPPEHCTNIGNAHRNKHYPNLSAALMGENNPSKLPGVGAKISAAKKKYHAEHPEAKTREKNGNWDGGIGDLPYDQEFTPSFKESVRADGNHICQLCGKTEAQEIAEFGQRLSVHHCLYGKVTKEDIFVALCCKCNGKVNKRAEKDYWTKFFVARMFLAA